MTKLKNAYLANPGKSHALVFALGGGVIAASVLFGADIDMELRHKIALAVAVAVVAGLVAALSAKAIQGFHRVKDGDSFIKIAADVKAYKEYGVLDNSEENDSKSKSLLDSDDDDYEKVDDEDEISQTSKPQKIIKTRVKEYKWLIGSYPQSFFDRNPKKTSALIGAGIGALTIYGLYVYGKDIGFDLDLVTNDKILLGVACAMMAGVLAIVFEQSKDFAVNAFANHVWNPEAGFKRNFARGPFKIEHTSFKSAPMLNNRALVGAVLGAGIAAALILTELKEADLAVQLMIASAIIMGCEILSVFADKHPGRALRNAQVITRETREI